MWLPSWPTQRLRRRGGCAPDIALATVATRGTRRLAAVCPIAAERGLHPDQPLTEARAICPDLLAVDADPAADLAALAALAGWCERYSPLAAADPPDGVFVDIAGCAHLLDAAGDEAVLLAHLAASLARSGLQARMAVAGTTGAAWALARSPTARAACTVLPPGTEAAALASLPVALLRLDRRCVAGLRRVGLKSIGELARQPRADLTARFGAGPMLRLGHAFGTVGEAISWPRPPLAWAERLAFAEPIGTAQDLASGLDLLANRLCARLQAGQRGGHGFAATFFRVDDQALRIEIATALPVDAAGYVVKLLCAKLDTVDPGFGVEAMLLEAPVTAPLRRPQTELGAADRSQTDLIATLDGLGNRLPPGRIWRPTPYPSHVPERGVRKAAAMPAMGTMPTTGTMPAMPAWRNAAGLERPLRLLHRPEPIEATAPIPDDPPIQFRWRGALHRVRAADGPERIAAEWWRRPSDPDRAESDRLRDYYRVEDSGGARFWIFRVGLVGLPRWFLHGLFG